MNAISGKPMTRRVALRWILAGSGAALLSACAPLPAGPTPALVSTTPPEQPRSATAPAATPAAAQSPRRGGTLRIAAREPTNLDPHPIVLNGFENTWQSFDTLTQYDTSLKPQPRLAESFDVTSDYKQIKLSLRKGVQFHTGRELTSDDVKWNLLRVRDPSARAQQGSWSSWFQTIDTPDKYTLVLTSDQSRPAMFDLFEFLNIADPETMQGPEANSKLVGTGPFKLVEWNQGQSMRFVRNPNYWMSGKPYLDEVVVNFPPDSQAAVVQLEAGALDDVVLPPLRDSARLQQDPKYRVLSNERSGQAWLVAANASIPPANNTKLRQALNHALDRQRLTDTLLLKQSGQPRDLPWPPHSPAYEPQKNNQYTFDLDRAKALFKEAGAENVEIELPYSPLTETINDFAQVLKADLEKIGVSLKLNKMEMSPYLDYLRSLKYPGVTLGLTGFAAVQPASLFVGAYYTTSSSVSITGFTSDRYAQLITMMSSEPDEARRKELYSQMNDVLLEESVTMVMAPNAMRVASRANVQGVRWRINEVRAWEEMWLAA
jgi:peptide/nickel transport system substrate-binding protein